MPNKKSISVIGLGYVGLPLAIYLSQHYKVFGFDSSFQRIKDLRKAIDKNFILNNFEKNKLKKINFYNDLYNIKYTKIILVCLPTPVNRKKKPDLNILKNACKNIGKYLTKGSTVIFESTVYPGVTEEVCVPILEKFSKMKWKKEFYIGYSPERISPGKKHKKIYQIKKIISADVPKTLKLLKEVYGKIIKAGIYVAQSIKVAEAAKLLENTQRDVNIALMNEISIIFNKLKINTSEVIKAASSKWNFNIYKPGLVGGHCIGVDPYYLSHKSLTIGHQPDLILTSRKINENMSRHIFNQIKKFFKNSIKKKVIKILILGVTYKEDCNDLRNSKVNDFIKLINKSPFKINVCDPLANKIEFAKITSLRLKEYKEINNIKYDAVILSQPHSFFMNKIKKIQKLVKFGGCFYDVKSICKDRLNNIYYLEL